MKTAVDWLVDQMINQGYFNKNKPLTFTNLDHLQHQAKEMEKQQIIDTYRDGRSDQQSARNGKYYSRMAEQYYNETFNNED